MCYPARLSAPCIMDWKLCKEVASKAERARGRNTNAERIKSHAHGALFLFDTTSSRASLAERYAGVICIEWGRLIYVQPRVHVPSVTVGTLRLQGGGSVTRGLRPEAVGGSGCLWVRARIEPRVVPGVGCNRTGSGL